MCVWGKCTHNTDVYTRVTCRLSYNFSTVSGFQMAYYYYDLMALDTFLLIPFHHVVCEIVVVLIHYSTTSVLALLPDRACLRFGK